jgi:hypothetical protein
MERGLLAAAERGMRRPDRCGESGFDTTASGIFRTGAASFVAAGSGRVRFYQTLKHQVRQLRTRGLVTRVSAVLTAGTTTYVSPSTFLKTRPATAR